MFERAVDLLNKTISLAGMKVSRNIACGDGDRRALDIYAPKAARQAPVIVFFYGGSWKFGGRADYRFVAATLAKHGFVVVVPDYRLYPEVRFPEFLHDGAAAIAWVLRNIETYQGDATRVFLLGHSAGAYNAMMLALDRQYLAAEGCDADRLSGVVGLAGPYDFLPLRDPDIKDIFSPPTDIRQTQPISFVRPGAPPLFLLHGGADITVLPRNTTALAARQSEAGGVAASRIYPSLGHIGIILSLLPYLSWRAPVLRDVLAFLTGGTGYKPVGGATVDAAQNSKSAAGVLD